MGITSVELHVVAVVADELSFVPAARIFCEKDIGCSRYC